MSVPTHRSSIERAYPTTVRPVTHSQPVAGRKSKGAIAIQSFRIFSALVGLSAIGYAIVESVIG